MNEELAVELGQALARPGDFVRIVLATQVGDDLVDIYVDLLRKRSKEDVYRFLDEQVWSHAHRRAFFLQYPLREVLSTYLSSTALDVDDIHFVVKAIRYGAEVGRMASHIFPAIVNTLAHSDFAHVKAACALLRVFSGFEEWVECMFDPKIFQAIANTNYFAEVLSDVSAFTLRVSREPLGALVVAPVVMRMLGMVGSCCVKDSHAEVVYDLLTALYDFPEWHVDVAKATTRRMALSQWVPPSSTTLLRAMLRTSCVLCVVVLYTEDLLESTRAVLRERSDLVTWKLLEAQWPSKEAEQEAAVGRVECPITLHRCRRPVLASDGHTYERVAILTHMARIGFTSPMTTEPLLPYLYPNRVAVEDGSSE